MINQQDCLLDAIGMLTRAMILCLHDEEYIAATTLGNAADYLWDQFPHD